MPCRAFAGMTVVQRARFCLRQSHILGHVLYRQRRGHDKEIWRPANLSDRNKIAHWIPAQLGIESGAGGEERRDQEPRVTIGRGARDLLGRDRAIGAGFGFDDDRAVPLRRHVLADDARKHIRDASRRIGNDDAHRSIGKALLRPPCSRCGKKRQPRSHDHADAPYLHGVWPALIVSPAPSEKRRDLPAGCR